MQRERPVVDCSKSPSLTRQSCAAATDLHAAVVKYRKTGVASRLLQDCEGAVFGDFSTSPTDYLDAQVKLRNADQAFASLPALVRDRFANDPVQLLTFLADPANFDEAVRLGLAVPRPEEKVGTEPATKVVEPTA